jgi:hypothetical protein
MREKPFEVVPANVSRQDLKDEANRRAAKAGYCSRSGDPLNRTKIMSQGIGQSKLNVWPRDKNGNLIE